MSKKNTKYMKNLFILLFIVTSATAQKLTVDAIIPIKTYHFDAKEKYRYAAGEGGNAGLVISATENRKYLDNVYSLGYIKNSFGDWSFIGTYGKSLRINKTFTIGVNVGIASNYGEAYRTTKYLKDDVYHVDPLEGSKKVIRENRVAKKKLNIFYKHSLLPFAALTLNVKVTDRFGIITNINPYYINTGIVINLKNFK